MIPAMPMGARRMPAAIGANTPEIEPASDIMPLARAYCDLSTSTLIVDEYAGNWNALNVPIRATTMYRCQISRVPVT